MLVWLALYKQCMVGEHNSTLGVGRLMCKLAPNQEHCEFSRYLQLTLSPAGNSESIYFKELVCSGPN